MDIYEYSQVPGSICGFLAEPSSAASAGLKTTGAFEIVPGAEDSGSNRFA